MDVLSPKQMKEALWCSRNHKNIAMLLLLVGCPLLEADRWYLVFHEKNFRWCKLMFCAGQFEHLGYRTAFIDFLDNNKDSDKLQHLCRIKIRKILSNHTKRNILRDIASLPEKCLNNPCRTYLLYGEDVDVFLKTHQIDSFF